MSGQGRTGSRSFGHRAARRRRHPASPGRLGELACIRYPRTSLPSTHDDDPERPDRLGAPDACTLPTTEQPLRLAEFDAFFCAHVDQVRRDDGQVVLSLTGGAEATSTAAGLAAREAECCSFFVFDLRIADDALSLTVSTRPGHAGVLAALADRAETLAGTAS